MNNESGLKWKLGAFVIIGLAVFALGIFFVGKQQNLFGSTLNLQARFKTVSGLEVGNNVRFSGINVGTVNDITLMDTVVMVRLVIKKEFQKFIKKDATANIGSDGLMGDKVLTIFPGSFSEKHVNDEDIILTRPPIDMEGIMSSLQKNVDNAGIVTAQLAEFTIKINNGNGALSKMISDEAFSNSLGSTLVNLQKSSDEFAQFTVKMNSGNGVLSTLVSDQEFAGSLKTTMANLQKSSDEFSKLTANMNEGDGPLSKLVNDKKMSRTMDTTMQNLQEATGGINDVIEAAQHNFLLRGFFKKKAKAEAKKAAERKISDSLALPVVNIIREPGTSVSK